MVVLGYLGIMKMIELAEKSGEEQLANSGGGALKAFVDGDVEGMQAAIAKNANEEFLYESVALNNVEDVASALAAGGNVHMINTAGATLLHRAVANGSVEIAEMLIEYERGLCSAAALCRPKPTPPPPRQAIPERPPQDPSGRRRPRSVPASLQSGSAPGPVRL